MAGVNRFLVRLVSMWITYQVWYQYFRVSGLGRLSSAIGAVRAVRVAVKRGELLDSDDIDDE